jgi:hypothetical protein
MIICDYLSESLIIWWLFDWLFVDYFFWILDYLMLIWCLFDDYSNYLMIICHFVQAHFSAHSSATAISLSCWACLHCGLQTIGNLKPGCDGVADTESSTGLCFGACRCAGFAVAGQSAWSLAMNADQRSWLGGTLRSCLLQKACCGSYRQKWENGQRRTSSHVNRIHVD